MAPQKRMARMRDAGVTPTMQRLAILEHLERTKAHPTADEVFAAVHKTCPTIARATVYNTLEALTKSGTILQLTVDPGAARYDADTGPHAHFRCRLCGKVYDIDAILKFAPLEERIYRHRCVEGWSIVVPWIGFPLNALIKQAEPLSNAKFVAFQSYYNSKQMPEGKYAGIPLPYVEGLRMDEAMHPLALLCVGMYGETLPNQNGAPVRLVLPWKYGFKSIKSVVKIKFVEKQPPATWNIANSHEYGFYSNVNPEVDHPRWSQAKERRLGEFFKRPTLKFNGYEKEVGALYAGMDLRKFY